MKKNFRNAWCFNKFLQNIIFRCLNISAAFILQLFFIDTDWQVIDIRLHFKTFKTWQTIWHQTNCSVNYEFHHFIGAFYVSHIASKTIWTFLLTIQLSWTHQQTTQFFTNVLNETVKLKRIMMSVQSQTLPLLRMNSCGWKSALIFHSSKRHFNRKKGNEKYYKQRFYTFFFSFYKIQISDHVLGFCIIFHYIKWWWLRLSSSLF